MPLLPTDEQVAKANDVFHAAKQWACDLGLPGWLADGAGGFAGLIVLTGGWLFTVVLTVYTGLFGPFFQALLQAIDEARRAVNPTIGLLAVDVLNELFGGELTTGDLSPAVGQAGMRQRAQAIGNKFRDSLLSEFVPKGKVTPETGYDAAAAFSGYAVNFAVGTAFIAILADALSFGHFEQFREMGVSATRNLGLGRMQARAWRAIIDEVVNKPAQRYVLQQYRTTILSEPVIVGLVDAGLLDSTLAAQWLAWLGYPDSLFNSLFEYHRKRLDDATVERLLRYGLMSTQDAVDYFQRQGFTRDIAVLKLADLDLARADHYVQQKANFLLKSFLDGALDAVQWQAAVGDLNLGAGTQQALLALGGTMKETPRKFLTEAQAAKALAENVMDLDGFAAHLIDEGYSLDDQHTLTLLALIQTGRAAEAQKVAEYRWRKAVASAEAKGLPPPPKPPILSNP
jgi:hypothetical protein